MAEINCLADFVAEVANIAGSWSPSSRRVRLWFRGQSSSKWSLKPSLYRKYEAYPKTVEDHYRTEFKIRGPQILDGSSPKDDWEWYYLMQHYGFPTRLLDWTDSALVALYFAIRSPSDSNPSVWVLDPRWLNQLSISVSSIATPEWPSVLPYLPEMGQSASLPRKPVAIDPVHVTKRLSAQRGHFTLHGSDPSPLERFGKTSRVRKLVIARKGVQRIEYELACCGVLDSVIFPDLEGLSRELVKDLAL